MKGAAVAYGILLLAHGGDKSWDAQVSALRAQIDVKVPAETALGMADPQAISAALERLEKRGVRRVAAVPLFVNSRSEVMDQTRYVLGLAKEPSAVLRAAAERMAAGHAHGRIKDAPHRHLFSLERVKTGLAVTLAPALDGDPLVSRVLLERARGLSKEPRSETVVLVAHGPVDDAAVGAWEKTLALHARFVRREGGFRAASFAVLRDDAAPGIRARAVAALRGQVTRAGRGGRALVVPVLIARGGIEGKLVKDLAGLDYAWDGATLMPHEGFADWALSRAARVQKAR